VQTKEIWPLPARWADPRPAGGLPREHLLTEGISLAAASQHASVLRDAGLIAGRRQGSAVLHVLTPLGAGLLRAG